MSLCFPYSDRSRLAPETIQRESVVSAKRNSISGIQNSQYVRYLRKDFICTILEDPTCL